jgi:hypothetical protein
MAADGTGCGQRIRGPLEECTGEAIFDDVAVERKYSPVKMEFDSHLGLVVRKELTLASVSHEAAAAASPPFWFEHTEEVHQILLGNPGSRDFNLAVLSVIAEQTKLKGHVRDEDVVQRVALVCSDGGADFMSSHGASDFGEHGSMVPIIASGHEEMNFLKTLLKVAFHLGAGVMATFHTWATSKAQETLMSGCDTHKAIDFLLDVCKKSVETALVHEWLDHLQVTNSAIDPKSVDSMWAWIGASTDANFRNHVHFWIKSLGALSLLRKAVRSHESSCHENYRAAQKFLLPYFLACHATDWGPLLLRDIRIIDFQLTEELRVVYKEISACSSRAQTLTRSRRSRRLDATSCTRRLSSPSRLAALPLQMARASLQRCRAFAAFPTAARGIARPRPMSLKWTSARSTCS